MTLMEVVKVLSFAFILFVIGYYVGLMDMAYYHKKNYYMRERNK